MELPKPHHTIRFTFDSSLWHIGAFTRNEDVVQNAACGLYGCVLLLQPGELTEKITALLFINSSCIHETVKK